MAYDRFVIKFIKRNFKQNVLKFSYDYSVLFINQMFIEFK